MEMSPELVKLLSQLLDICIELAKRDEQTAKTQRQVQQLVQQIQAILDVV